MAIAVYKQLSVEVIVAVGEADPQIAFLCRRYPDHFGVFTDGDILAYGCPRALVGLVPTYTRAGVRESWTGAWIDTSALSTGESSGHVVCECVCVLARSCVWRLWAVVTWCCACLIC